MTKKPGGWEGTLLLFGVVFTVLLGVTFNLAFVYRFPIPWFVILLISVAVALGWRYLRRSNR
jgi:hypothetical protein